MIEPILGGTRFARAVGSWASIQYIWKRWSRIRILRKISFIRPFIYFCHNWNTSLVFYSWTPQFFEHVFTFFYEIVVLKTYIIYHKTFFFFVFMTFDLVFEWRKYIRNPLEATQFIVNLWKTEKFANAPSQGKHWKTHKAKWERWKVKKWKWIVKHFENSLKHWIYWNSKNPKTYKFFNTYFMLHRHEI